MVFYDITEDSMTWDWEASYDRGDTWTLNWRIFYKRKKKSNNSELVEKGFSGEFLLKKVTKYYDPEGKWDVASIALHIQEPRPQSPYRYSKLSLDNRTGHFSLSREYEEGIIERIITSDGESLIKLNGSTTLSDELKHKYRLRDEVNLNTETFIKL